MYHRLVISRYVAYKFRLCLWKNLHFGWVHRAFSISQIHTKKTQVWHAPSQVVRIGSMTRECRAPIPNYTYCPHWSWAPPWYVLLIPLPHQLLKNHGSSLHLSPSTGCYSEQTISFPILKSTSHRWGLKNAFFLALCIFPHAPLFLWSVSH